MFIEFFDVFAPSGELIVNTSSLLQARIFQSRYSESQVYDMSGKLVDETQMFAIYSGDYSSDMRHALDNWYHICRGYDARVAYPWMRVRLEAWDWLNPEKLELNILMRAALLADWLIDFCDEGSDPMKVITKLEAVDGPFHPLIVHEAVNKYMAFCGENW